MVVNIKNKSLAAYGAITSSSPVPTFERELYFNATNGGFIMTGRKHKASEYEIWLGQTIAITRVRFGMSQKGLAERVGVTFQQIQKYETGGNRISVAQLKKVADAFEMTIGQLVDGGITGKYPHDKAVIALLDLLYTKIKTPQKRKILLTVARCMAKADIS